jgi:phage terminase small subunit
MSLTPKQEKFAQLYVELGNASEAYRQAYNSKAKADSVKVEASKLLSQPNVSLTVQRLREELEEKSLWKRLDSIKTLASIADGTEPEAKISDRVNAVKALNSMHGWDKQVIEHSNPDGSLNPANAASAVLSALESKHKK